jgi:uncharacterized protein YjiS (DUF1127 family)
MADDGFSHDTCTIRHLSCRERMAMKERVIARANDERQRLLRHWAAQVIAALRPAWRRLSELYMTTMRHLVARHMRMNALRQLAAMSDRELRDMGISRLEIRAAARSDAAWPRGERSTSTTQVKQGENYAESLLDRPRLCS